MREVNSAMEEERKGPRQDMRKDFLEKVQLKLRSEGKWKVTEEGKA